MWSVHINICITGYNWIKVHTYRHKGVCVCVYTWHMCVCMSVSQSSGTWLFSLHRLRLFPPHPAQQQWKNWHTCWPSVQFSCSVMSDSLWPHELQHARPPCPAPTPRVHSDSRPSSHWCHSAISSSVIPFFSCPQSLPLIRVFSNESSLHMRWPKYWSFSFSISPSKEHPGLISFSHHELFIIC